MTVFTGHQQAMVDLITDRLRNGIMHPGDPANNVAPRPIVLPFKSSPGMPKEMGDLMNATAAMLAEAIVATVVTDGDTDLIPRAELASLRITSGEAGTAPRMVNLHCRCDRRRESPLAVLTVTDPDCIVVDGKALLRGLHQRAVDCPHTTKEGK